MTDYIQNERGEKLAYHKTQGALDLPGVFFCGGFMSDMSGSKATTLEALCKARGQAYTRFDYSGHGESEGAFIDGTIGHWLEDAVTVFDAATSGPQILVGSSMGGWIALLLAMKRAERIKGIVGVAAAPDFVSEMYNEQLSAAQRQELADKGITFLPSEYEQPYPISRALVEDGELHRLLHQQIMIHCPVRLLQGTNDAVVPANKPERIQAALASKDVTIEMIEGGDHSLSRPEDIDKIDAAIQALSS